MRREILRGRSVAEVQAKVDRVKKEHWYPVSDIKVDPSSMDMMDFVCVIETQKTTSKRNSDWGKRFHLGGWE